MKTGKLIGAGRTAEVFEWGEGQVIKLYVDRFGQDLCQYESNLIKVISEAGAPAPAFFGNVEYGGRAGMLMEKLEGEIMFDLMKTRLPRLAFFAQQMARMHWQIHQAQVDKGLIIGQQDKFLEKINLASVHLGDRIHMVTDYIDKLPDGDRVCHGDFHPKNMLYHTSGSWGGIDWTNAYRGHPLGDFAKTYLRFSGPYVTKKFNPRKLWFYKAMRNFIRRSYKREYLKVSGYRWEEVVPWLVPAAVSQIKSGKTTEYQWLLALIDKQLDQVAYNN